MSDFMKEIKLSYNAYREWIKIKGNIEYCMKNSYDKKIVGCINLAIAEEIEEFLGSMGFDDICMGKRVFGIVDDEQRKLLIRRCYFNVFGEKRRYPKIPYIIRW